MSSMTPAEILKFWREAGPEKWFAKDEDFDAEIARRFGAVQREAAAGNLASWEDSAEGAYALLILLDQFPRNLYRGSAQAFASDHLAVEVAQRALAQGFDQRFPNPERRFFYLPFTHAEDLALQERCVTLSRASGDEDALKWAELHRDVIRDFGRFPHRNAVLGRETSPEEREFLEEGGFAG